MIDSRTFRHLWRVSAITFFVASAALFGVAPLFSVSTASAAIPTTMGYQGRLKDSSGTALTGTYSFTFRLYATSTGGVAAWTETQPAVTVDQGAFAVQLGSVTPFPVSLDFNQPVFLTTEVNSDGEMSPRVPLNAVAYAYTTAGVNALPSAPSTPTGGRMYYDTGLGTLNYYDEIAASWKALGTSTSSIPSFQQVTAVGNTTTDPIQFAGGTSTAGFMPSLDAALSLGSAAFRWDGQFGSVTTTNLVASNLVVTSGTIGTLNGGVAVFSTATTTNLFATTVSTTNLFVDGQAVTGGTQSTTATLQTITNNGATTSNAITAFGGLTTSNLTVTGTATLQALLFTNSTGTSATTTNLFVTNGMLTNGTITNGAVSNLSFTNGTSTSWFGFVTASGTTLNALSGTVNSLTAPTLISSNATISGGVLNGTAIGATVPSTGIFTNTTSTNLSATNGSVSNLVFTNGTSTSWFGFGVASGTSVFASSIQVNGSSVCLANGANCPSGTSPNFQAVTDIGNTTTNAIQFAGGTSTGDFMPSLDATLSLGSPALRWNGQFGSVTTTNLVVTNATSSNLFVGNLAAATVSTTNLFVNGQRIASGVPATTATLQTITDNGATTADAITAFGGLTTSNLTATGTSNLQALTFTNATGTSATSTNLFATNGAFTNGVITNGTVSNLAFTNGTSTSWLGFATASGTALNASAIAVNGSSVCLNNGINCPSSALIWTDNTISDFVSLTTSTRDLVIGASASATAPFYFDVNSPTSSLQVGRSGNANLFVGTSTYGGGLNALFKTNGDDLFVQGNIGSATSVYSNGAFVATSTSYGPGLLTNGVGNLSILNSGRNIILQGTGAGKVGVGGTTNPLALLEVGGGAGNLAGATFGVNVNGQSLSEFRDSTDGVQGELAVGTINSINSVTFGSVTDHPLIIEVNNTNTDYFTDTGRLGIGTPNPLTALDVLGEVSSTGLLTGVNDKFNIGAPTSSWADIYASGTANLANVIATNATATNVFSTTVSTTNLLVGGKRVCLEDGTNCSIAQAKSASSTATTALSGTESDLLDITVTPAFTTDVVWVSGSVRMDNTGGTPSDVTLRLWRGASCGAGTQVGVDITSNLIVGATDNMAISFVDAASTTSATTYRLCGSGTGGTPDAANRSMIAQTATAGADLAEVYYSDDNTLAPGDVVELDPKAEGMVRHAASAYDENVLGVISTRPGSVLAEQSKDGGTPVLVGLAGRIPVKVTTQNGPIQAGDFLTASDIPGVAMKATDAGVTIGKALSDFDGTSTGLVMMFVQNGYHVPVTSPSELGQFMGPSSGVSNSSVASVLSNPAEFDGEVKILKHLYQGEDAAGYAKILAGSQTVEVKFKSNYMYPPIVTLTPDSEIKGTYWVEKATETGFTIRIGQVDPDRDTLLAWAVTAVEEPNLFISDGTSGKFYEEDSWRGKDIPAATSTDTPPPAVDVSPTTTAGSLPVDQAPDDPTNATTSDSSVTSTP